MPSPESLMPFAKYLWWKTPDEAVVRPERLYAQVMDIGDYEDTLRLVKLVGESALKNVLTHAEPGYFHPRSWAYWHYRLGVIKSGVPKPVMPRRVFSD